MLGLFMMPPEEDEGWSRVPLRRPYNMVIVTAPFDRPNSGDHDYAQGLCQLSSDSDVEIKHLNSFGMTSELRRALRWYSQNPSQRFPGHLQSERKAIVDKIFSAVKRNRGAINILNLQIRPPETGMLLFPGDFQRFKDAKVRITVTCHEYALYDDIGRRDKRQLNQRSRKYFDAADQVVFFNEEDKARAYADYIHYDKAPEKADAFLNKTFLSKVATPLSLGVSEVGYQPPILAMEPDVFLDRQPNILMFGAIRQGKGFEQVIFLAEQLARCQTNGEMPETARVIVAGTPNDLITVASLLIKSFSKEMLIETFGLASATASPTGFKSALHGQLCMANMDESLSGRMRKLLRNIHNNHTLPGRKLPIQFYFSLPPGELLKLFHACKYVYARDEHKGFACNASAMITALSQGCILIANQGSCTPEALYRGKKHAGSIILTPRQTTETRAIEMARDVMKKIVFFEQHRDAALEHLQKQEAFFGDFFSRGAIKGTFASIISGDALHPLQGWKRPTHQVVLDSLERRPPKPSPVKEEEVDVSFALSDAEPEPEKVNTRRSVRPRR
jgi:hypothetical protein